MRMEQFNAETRKQWMKQIQRKRGKQSLVRNARSRIMRAHVARLGK